MSPAQALNEATLAAQPDVQFVIISCFYGRRHLEQMLREGITLPDGSAHARLMDALVKVGCAKRWSATRRDV